MSHPCRRLQNSFDPNASTKLIRAVLSCNSRVSDLDFKGQFKCRGRNGWLLEAYLVCIKIIIKCNLFQNPNPKTQQECLHGKPSAGVCVDIKCGTQSWSGWSPEILQYGWTPCRAARHCHTLLQYVSICYNPFRLHGLLGKDLSISQPNLWTLAWVDPCTRLKRHVVSSHCAPWGWWRKVRGSYK